MFKLVFVAGKMRGKEFSLEEGDNVIGRDDECDIHIPIDGVSKNHASITVTGEVAYLKDLNSSNGTFLNGKMVKNRTIQNGDKVALPDTIIQVVWVEEKKILIKKAAAEDIEVEDTFLKPPPPPKSIFPKIIWFFRYRIMPKIHNFNEEYQWRVMLGIFLAVFVFVSMYLTLLPALDRINWILKSEVAARGQLYAEEIARLNVKALERKNLDQIDTSFIEHNKDIQFELFDLEGRIFRPQSKINTYTQDPFSVKARDWASKTVTSSGRPMVELLSNGEIGIAAKISAYNRKTFRTEALGVITLKFKPQSLREDKTLMTFLNALVIAGFTAIVFYGIIYFLTLKPLEEIKFQLEEAIRGKRRGIESKYLMDELGPLRNSINSVLQRVRELDKDSDDSEFDDVEDSGPYINTLIEFLNGTSGGALILDGDKNLQRINGEAEEITGIRETGSEGMSLLDVAREQGFAATVIELCDNSANNQGTSQQGNYELQGHDYDLYVVGLMGRDNFAKGFFVTFAKVE